MSTDRAVRLVARRHVDLLRTASAACGTPACCRTARAL
ncbi:putative leader peptide [Cellulomonas endophytica]